MSATTPTDEACAADPDKPTGPIKIMIADDHPIFRDGLQKLLSLEKDFEVVAQVGDGDQVLRAIEEHHPDVLLLDLKLPGTHGLTILQKLQISQNTTTKVIVLTASDDRNEFVQAMKLGTSRIVLKQSPTGFCSRVFAGFMRARSGWIQAPQRLSCANSPRAMIALRLPETVACASGRH